MPTVNSVGAVNVTPAPAALPTNTAYMGGIAHKPTGEMYITGLYTQDANGNVIGLGSINQSAGALSTFGIVPQTSRQFLSGQPIPAIQRVTNPGKIWYNFADDTLFTYAGATTGWSHSTVSGLNGITDLGQACTISNASPCVVGLTSHGKTTGDQVYFNTTGGLPTGLAINTPYWVIAAGLTANAFEVSAAAAPINGVDGAAVNTSSAGSGVFYFVGPTPYPTRGSRTGNPKLVKVQCDGSQAVTAYTMNLTANFAAVALNGKAGLWIYVSPDSTSVNSSITVFYSVTGGYAAAGGRSAAYNNYILRAGDNFLPFDDNVAQHPQGIAAAGSNNIIANSIINFQIIFNIVNGKTFCCYLDSLWTAWTTPVSRIMIGRDGNGTADLLDMKAAMDVYGWKGYMAFAVTGTNDFTLLLDYNTQPATGGDARMATCYNAGWDCCNETVNHATLAADTNTPSATAAQVTYQFEAQRAFCMGKGWIRGSEFFSAASNLTTWAQRALLKTLGVKSIRGYQGVVVPTTYGHDNVMDLVGQALDAPCGGGSAVLATWQAQTLGHINYGADMMVYVHSLIAGSSNGGATATGVGTQIYLEAFQLYLAWLNTNYVAPGTAIVCTPTEWLYGLK